MNGHQPILAMRRSGVKPASIWLNDYPSLDADYSVRIDAADMPESLDLRFVVGTTVIATSDKPARLKRIVNACKQAKAARVISNLFKPDGKYNVEIVEISDTEGIATWNV